MLLLVKINNGGCGQDGSMCHFVCPIPSPLDEQRCIFVCIQKREKIVNAKSPNGLLNEMGTDNSLASNPLNHYFTSIA